MDKKRRVSRRPLQPARIQMLDETGAANCFVRNASDTKAVLEVESPLNVPIEFDLLIDGDSKRHRCAVVWRKTRCLGVAFI